VKKGVSKLKSFMTRLWDAYSDDSLLEKYFQGLSIYRESITEFENWRRLQDERMDDFKRKHP